MTILVNYLRLPLQKSDGKLPGKLPKLSKTELFCSNLYQFKTELRKVPGKVPKLSKIGDLAAGMKSGEKSAKTVLRQKGF